MPRQLSQPSLHIERKMGTTAGAAQSQRIIDIDILLFGKFDHCD